MFTKSEEMLITNYFIENGSFARLSQVAPTITKKVSSMKKANDYTKDMNNTEFLEYKYLGNLNSSVVSLDLAKQIIRETGGQGINYDKLSRSAQNKLTRLSTKMMLDYPQTLTEQINAGTTLGYFSDLVTKSRDWGLYNSAINAILLGVNMKANQTKNFKIPRLKEFDSYSEIVKSEPLYEEVLSALVPKYSGEYPTQVEDGPAITFEGLNYYGPNLHLNNSMTLIDDILIALKGHSSGKYIPVSIRYRLDQMVEVLGNLNYIGLDEFSLLKNLNIVAIQSGFDTIKELLNAEGYNFEPLSELEYGVVPSFDQYELLLPNYDNYQIRIDKTLYSQLKSMNVLDSMFVGEVPYKGTTISILAFVYDGQVKMVHTLLTMNEEIDFIDGNTLNITKTNLRGV